MDFTDQDVEEFREAFELFDKTGDGTILNEEIGIVMRALSQNPTEEEIQKAIAAVDKEGTGNVNFDQFMKMMRMIPKDVITEESVRAAFRVFDKKGNGFISAEDLRHVMTTLGDTLSEEECYEMIRDADCESDGQIDYEEFVTMIMKK